jgi:hypothetical protein
MLVLLVKYDDEISRVFLCENAPSLLLQMKRCIVAELQKFLNEGCGPEDIKFSEELRSAWDSPEPGTLSAVWAKLGWGLQFEYWQAEIVRNLNEAIPFPIQKPKEPEYWLECKYRNGAVDNVIGDSSVVLESIESQLQRYYEIHSNELWRTNAVAAILNEENGDLDDPFLHVRAWNTIPSELTLRLVSL